MHVIVIGNGIAGINVASALRASPAVAVEVFGSEPHQMYSRVRLPEVLSGSSSPDSILFYKPEWYAKKGITVHTGAAVASIDRAAKKVTLEDGRDSSYDILVFATGASANRPPIPGSELPGVFTMRTMDDAVAIRANLASHPGRAAVIGGGLLGLEAARAMKDAGAHEVRVFEIADRLLPRQLDETGASLLRSKFASMGIDVVLSAETAGFEGVPTGENRVGAIALKDGRSFPVDTVILSMGVHSNVSLAKAAGISVNRGIVVDSRMCTSDPDIYAVGDCAEFEGVVWGIIPAALEQAPVAARWILASSGLLPPEEAVPYRQTVPKTALKVGSIELMSLGKAVLSNEEESSGRFIVMSRMLETEGRYEKFVLTPVPDGSPADSLPFMLCGAILLGSKEHQSIVQKMIGTPVSREQIDSLLGAW